MYAGGPCKDEIPSRGRVKISILPCVCPIGFTSIEADMLMSCDCKCDSKLLLYITDFDAGAGSLLREGDFWISSISFGDYLIFPHCPLDYHTRSKIDIDLNTKDGADVQCINHPSLWKAMWKLPTKF